MFDPINDIIVIWNPKGGVGKTPTAISLAKTFDMNIISNDTSVYETTYQKATVYANDQKIPVVPGTVYDFGGFYDNRFKPMLEVADVIIMPCFYDPDSLMKTVIGMQIINEHMKDSVKFLLLATRLKNIKHFDLIKTELETELEFKFYDKGESEEEDENIRILPIREGEMFKRVTWNGESVEEVSKHFLWGRTYKNMIKEYNEVVKYIKS
jgi:cellulose biosynthesis protein BcsQ